MNFYNITKHASNTTKCFTTEANIKTQHTGERRRRTQKGKKSLILK